MFVRGKIDDLTPINMHEVEDFIISSLDEIDYFKCNRENLVLLRNYLLELREKKKEYDRLIADPLKSIQEKNSWCIDVQPAVGDIYFMEAKAKNYPSVFIGEDGDKLFGSGIGYNSIDPRGFLYRKRMSKRHEILSNSKDELTEIKNILESFGFKEDVGLITASSHFLVIPHSFEEIEIQKRPIDSHHIHRIKLDKNDEFCSEHCGVGFDDKDGKKYANSFVKKLYLKNNQ